MMPQPGSFAWNWGLYSVADWLVFTGGAIFVGLIVLIVVAAMVLAWMCSWDQLKKGNPFYGLVILALTCLMAGCLTHIFG